MRIGAKRRLNTIFVFIGTDVSINALANTIFENLKLRALDTFLLVVPLVARLTLANIIDRNFVFVAFYPFHTVATDPYIVVLAYTNKVN